MLRILVVIFFVFGSSLTFSKELEEGKIYQLSVTALVKKVGDSITIYTAMKNNRYKVISKTSSGDYLVQFNKIYTSTSQFLPTSNMVKLNETYILPATISGISM